MFAKELDRAHLTVGLGYGALGMLLGIHMAASHNHQQLVTHAHLLLAGFVLSVLYALMLRLWVSTRSNSWLALVQFWVHHVGVTGMVTGLFLVYGQYMVPERVEPLLASASLAVFAGIVGMLLLVVTGRRGMPDAKAASGLPS